MTLSSYEQHDAMGGFSCLSVAASGSEQGMRIRLLCAAALDASQLFQTFDEMCVM